MYMTILDFFETKASRRSGGLLILWNPNLSVPLFIFEGGGLVGIKLSWKDLIIYVVNVYSLCSLHKKKRIVV